MNRAKLVALALLPRRPLSLVVAPRKPYYLCHERAMRFVPMRADARRYGRDG